jgi:hypothetical protein
MCPMACDSKFFTLALAGVLVVGCDSAPGEQAEVQPASAGQETMEVSAEDAFAALESRLLDAEQLHLRYRAGASGAVEARIAGELRQARDGSVQLTGNGSFMSDSVDMQLENAAGRLTGGNFDNSFDQATPAELDAALMLGLTRMGIMHNLARLSAGQPPDHAEGGVGEWLRATNFTAAPDSLAVPGAEAGIRFDIEVEGQKAAEATLWLNDEGLPLRRTQRVDFPGGFMEVVEEYEWSDA